MKIIIYYISCYIIFYYYTLLLISSILAKVERDTALYKNLNSKRNRGKDRSQKNYKLCFCFENYLQNSKGWRNKWSFRRPMRGGKGTIIIFIIFYWEKKERANKNILNLWRKKHKYILIHTYIIVVLANFDKNIIVCKKGTGAARGGVRGILILRGNNIIFSCRPYISRVTFTKIVNLSIQYPYHPYSNYNNSRVACPKFGHPALRPNITMVAKLYFPWKKNKILTCQANVWHGVRILDTLR